ncbi:prepilin peptidase [Peribacillus glennii]|uniref:Prepilin peptidase n=1 Tax=Peribacillus glennii TaxID=2303991 RepID=A0A372LIH5_9BACI|nr:A24 family peptidase [Peribacillus glennii]RFU65879.1 prepilin peptidase [Peribacillus glennii]
MISYLLSLLIGLILGSFFNVVGLSVPKKQSFTTRRSACPSCGRTLSAFELIPVLSYIIQGGKCRGCKARISQLYPIVELMTGMLFAAAPYFLGWSAELIVAWTLICLLMIIFVTDIAYMLIPDKILLFFAVVFLFMRIFLPLDPWWDSLLGAAVGFGLLLLIAVISKGGMGGGDIKLFALLGFVLGTKLVLLSFMAATFLGAFYGVIGILSGFIKRKHPIPFGPFIVVGTLAAYFFGDSILNWYFQFFAAS